MIHDVGIIRGGGGVRETQADGSGDIFKLQAQVSDPAQSGHSRQKSNGLRENSTVTLSDDGRMNDDGVSNDNNEADASKRLQALQAILSPLDTL